MQWETPQLLLVLWLLPVIGGVLLYARKKQLASAARFAESAMLERLLPVQGQGRAWWKATACECCS